MIKDIDINEIVISNKICFGKQDFKYFIGYKVNKKIKPLCIFCSRMSMYKRDFFIKMKICLDIYNEIWENVSNIIKKKIIGELIYNEKFLKAEKKINTKEEGFHCISKRVILIDSVYVKNEYCYLKVFLEKHYFKKDRNLF